MTTKEQERQPLASFAMRPGEDDLPPGYLRQGDHGEDSDGNYTVEQLNFKGYAKVWDNRTGVMSLQPRNLLWQTFTLKREDGSFIFTDRDPGIPQNYGLDMVCPLHLDSPDFAEAMRMGFKPCKKHHTPTHAALEAHVQHSHKRYFAARLEVRAERRRQEDRELQLEVIRSNRDLMRSMAGSPAKPVKRRAKK